VADAQKSIYVFDSEINAKRILLKSARYLDTARIVLTGVEDTKPALFSREKSENVLTNF
jgi:hypothetical protein